MLKTETNQNNQNTQKPPEVSQLKFNFNTTKKEVKTNENAQNSERKQPTFNFNQ